ncbi:MAG: class I SAM-dependent methyltransferase [Thermoanaerobacteraceae bacterium]|nr:class I SAM-dependent methyltransferase [Thermoanaerobacteraceae bacterium]
MVPERTASATAWAQAFIAPVLIPGSVAVDATAGKGLDTEFLARGVGAAGRVFAFDIQPGALEITRQRLAAAGLLERVTLLHRDHAAMAAHVPPPVNAVMFNLGYLPGGDHRIVTRPGTTLRALQDALALLAPKGRLSLVVYTGHPGARQEQETLEEYAAHLPPREFTVLRLAFWNRSSRAPVVILVEKAGGGS